MCAVLPYDGLSNASLAPIRIAARAAACSASGRANIVSLCVPRYMYVFYLLSIAVPPLCADLEPKRKAYLMQNIMASRYIVAQQKRLHTSPSRAADTAGLHQSHHPGGALGCAHYKRRSARLCDSCIRIMRVHFESRLSMMSTAWHPATNGVVKPSHGTASVHVQGQAGGHAVSHRSLQYSMGCICCSFWHCAH